MKIIGMIPVYNDEDIIEEIIQHHIAEGLDLVILDNGSSDQTLEMCKKYVGNGVLQVDQYLTNSYVSEWDTLLRMLYDMALVHSPDWVIRNDSDEFLESGVSNLTLKEAIEKADSEEFNLIQFDRFDFFMTDKDNVDEKSIRKKMPYYTYHGDFLYRAWKYSPGIRISQPAVGHYPIFPENLKYKIYPKKFVMRHYPYRNKEQARQKIRGRIRASKSTKTDDALNAHIENIIKQDFTQKFDHKKLNLYEEGKINYELNFHPYMDKIPPRREEIFSEEGFLRVKSKTPYQLNLESHQMKKKSIKFRIKKRLFNLK
ncbi:MAG TPA: glycosyltransferase family 2 protein [Nitrosopumilaceae archaeon]|nr:glycosyltransferase family 2 protein [Nitrosopumilaceae archaeon]